MSGVRNPYAAPSASGADPFSADMQLTSGPPHASQNKRFANYFIDNIVLRILALGVGLVFGFLWAMSNGGGVNPNDEIMFDVIGFLVGILSTLTYYAALEAIFGVTLGKLITGTRVVHTDGSRASVSQILGRSLARMIPFEPLSYLFGDKTLGWHDTMSNTKVVDIRKAD